jgi:uncharacterized RDD family membrane protein YckC
MVAAGAVIRFGPREEAELCTFDGELAVCENPTTITWVIAAIVGLVGLVAVVVWQVRRQGSTGQTHGAKVRGFKVVGKTSHQPIGAGRCIVRYFARMISAIPCYVGFLSPLWAKEKQTFHDKVMNTVVVKA